MRQPRADILLAVLSLLLTLPALAAANRAPHEVVASSAEQVADRLEGRRGFLAEHPQELYSLIDEVLLPNFDTRYAGFLVLGRSNWNAASGQQRDRFVAAFFDFLVRNYAEGLLEFDPRSIEVLDSAEPADEKRTTVQTRMRQDNGTVVPIIYALRNTSDGWKVYDVRIEGVSYLQNYRNQFNAEISANGIDAVIARLEQETADVPRPSSVE